MKLPRFMMNRTSRKLEGLAVLASDALISLRQSRHVLKDDQIAWKRLSVARVEIAQTLSGDGRSSCHNVVVAGMGENSTKAQALIRGFIMARAGVSVRVIPVWN